MPVVSMLLVGSVLGITIAITIAVFTTKEPSPDALAEGQRRYERQLAKCLEGDSYELEGSGFGTVEELCAEYIRPNHYAVRFVDLTELLQGTAQLVILLGAVLGATLGGADWSTSAMATLLAWEPRRIRVLAARAIAVIAVTVVLTVVAQAFLALAFAGLVSVRGTFDGTPAGLGGDLASEIVRISALATVFALIGLALATIGRSTAAGLGLLLGYLIVIELFAASLLFWVQKIALGRSAVTVVLDEPMQLFDDNAVPPVQFLLMPGRGWLNLGAWTLVLLGVAAAAFRGRDVT